jgi:predicted transcriptional regulator
MNVTHLSNIMSTKSSFKSPFALLYGEKPKLHDNLKMFGEVGVITTKERMQAKLSNRGTACMFVGYTEHHSRDVYRILNLTTNSIINSQDIIWLNKNDRKWKDNKATISNVEDDTIELPTGVDKVKLTENAIKETEDKSNKLDKKVFRAMRKLESWFNPEATKAVEDYSHGREMILDQVNLALFSTVTVKEPTTYEEARNCEKKEDQIKWKSAINKELKEMEKRGVWEIIDEKNIPINRQCFKNKWIFKVKRNGIF